METGFRDRDRNNALTFVTTGYELGLYVLSLEYYDQESFFVVKLE